LTTTGRSTAGDGIYLDDKKLQYGTDSLDFSSGHPTFNDFVYITLATAKQYLVGTTYAFQSWLSSTYNNELRIQTGGAADPHVWIGTTTGETNRDVRFITANTNAIRFSGTDQHITALPTYSYALGGSLRPLQINATGDIGYDASSIRYKTNLRNLTDADFNWILDLNPQKYDRIDGSAFDEVGLIAEEVQSVYPKMTTNRTNITYIYDCLNESDEKAEYKIYYDKKDIPEGLMCMNIVDEITDTGEVETVEYNNDFFASLIKLVQDQEQENQMLKDKLCLLRGPVIKRFSILCA